jgi:hypothetical protein
MANSITYKANKIDLKQGGSLINRLAETSAKGPVVGEGATKLSYSDRKAFFVTYVSKDGKECRIQKAKTKCLNYYDGVYDIQPDPEGVEVTLRYRHGKWRRQSVCRWSGKTQWDAFSVAFGYASEYEDPCF